MARDELHHAAAVFFGDLEGRIGVAEHHVLEKMDVERGLADAAVKVEPCVERAGAGVEPVGPAFMLEGELENGGDFWAR